MKRGSLMVLLRLLALVKPLSLHMLLAVLMGTLGCLCAQFIPILGAYGLLLGLGIGPFVSAKKLFFLLILIALLRALLKYGEQRENHYIAFTLLAIIRDRVFKALRRLCPAKLEGRDKGDLIELITSDVELLEVFYAHTVSPVCIAVLTELVMVCLIGSYHFLPGLLSLLAYLSVGVLCPLWIHRKSGNLGDELRADNAQMGAFLYESIRGLSETIQYGDGNRRLGLLSEKTEALSKKQGRQNHLTGVNLSVSNSLVLFFDAAMFALCAFLYSRGAVGFDGFLIPLIALMSSFGPVMALSNLGTALQSTIASGARILAVLDEKPETEEISLKEEISFSGAEAREVCFSYGSERVLTDLSMSFPQKGILGIVGPSGCGKSTLLKLLMRFWSTDAGEISISGRSVEEINTRNLRRLESYMTQETHLFRDTIGGNLRIARSDASQEEIEKACKKASVHDFIMGLPKGYETMVGELGETLSSGERQRIALARAFLHDAPFLLLDEPTSNLDSLNEAVILKSLKEGLGEKSVVLVSHRRSTVRIADQMLEMNSLRESGQPKKKGDPLPEKEREKGKMGD